MRHSKGPRGPVPTAMGKQSSLPCLVCRATKPTATRGSRSSSSYVRAFQAMVLEHVCSHLIAGVGKGCCPPSRGSKTLRVSKQPCNSRHAFAAFERYEGRLARLGARFLWNLSECLALGLATWISLQSGEEEHRMPCHPQCCCRSQ